MQLSTHVLPCLYYCQGRWRKQSNGYGPVLPSQITVLCWSASAAQQPAGEGDEWWSRPQGILKAGRERDGDGWCGGSASGATRNRVKAGARSTPYIKQSIETWGALHCRPQAREVNARTQPCARARPSRHRQLMPHAGTGVQCSGQRREVRHRGSRF